MGQYSLAMHMDENTQGVLQLAALFSLTGLSTGIVRTLHTTRYGIQVQNMSTRAQSYLPPYSSCLTPIDWSKLREGQGVWGEASQI